MVGGHAEVLVQMERRHAGPLDAGRSAQGREELVLRRGGREYHGCSAVSHPRRVHSNTDDTHSERQARSCLQVRVAPMRLPEQVVRAP